MRLGIIGLPQSGKTTVFNALTRGNQPTTVSGVRFEVRTAVVDVPDSRVDRLVEMFHPLKMAYAKVTYADITGLEGGHAGSRDEGIAGAMLNQLTQMDGFVHVVRCFENASVPHPKGSVDPLRDINALDEEFLLNDLIAVERKLERLVEEQKKGGGRDKALIGREITLFERLKATLSADTALRQIELSAEEEKSLSGFGFLSRKPVLLVLNLADGQAPPDVHYNQAHSVAAPMQGKLEMELAQLPPEDAELFMAEYGIQELGMQRVISLSYDLLGLQSFFTVGEDEVRAWTIHRGDNAQQAAAKVHTDLAKGFVRAEVFTYAELEAAAGDERAMKAKHAVRLEGREYLVKDGDVLNIRANTR
jgi:ribosome-binding ATPase